MGQKSIYWLPRILSIILIIFYALFSLDIVTSDLSVEMIIIGLFLHNIPTLILLIALIISWRYEIVGGVVFILASLLYVIVIFTGSLPWNHVLLWSLIVAGPAFLIGALFLANWLRKKSKT